MKFSFLILLFPVFFSCSKCVDAIKANFAECVPVSLSGNVIAFYTFADSSTQDFSGYGNHLVNNTAAHPATDRSGNLGCAFEFDNLPSGNQYLTSQNTQILNNLNEFSLSIWYLTKDSTRDAGMYETLISRDSLPNHGDRRGQWSLGLYDCRRPVFASVCAVWDSAQISNCEFGTTADFPDWQHVVCTYQKATNSTTIYKNGVFQETLSGSSCTSFPSIQDVGDLFIGLNFTGVIDDVVILNRVISAQEALLLFQLNTCC